MPFCPSKLFSDSQIIIFSNVVISPRARAQASPVWKLPRLAILCIFVYVVDPSISLVAVRSTRYSSITPLKNQFCIQFPCTWVWTESVQSIVRHLEACKKIGLRQVLGKNTKAIQCCWYSVHTFRSENPSVPWVRPTARSRLSFGSRRMARSTWSAQRWDFPGGIWTRDSVTAAVCACANHRVTLLCVC